MKLKTPNQLVSLAVMVAIFLSTGLLARELPGDWAGLQLGQAYDSRSHNAGADKCVVGRPKQVGQAVGDLKYTRNASFDQISRAFSGAASLSLDVPFTKIQASTSYATENAATDTRMNWFFEFHATPKSLAIDLDELDMSPLGRRLRANEPQRISSICGDEFVFQIDYGAKLIVTMSVEFSSKEDKDKFALAAALGVNFVIGSASINAEMQKMQRTMGTRTNIKIDARQIGGQSGELLSIIDNGIEQCDLNNIDRCIGVFNQVLQYARNDFRRQLQREDGFSVVRYQTVPYERSAAYELVPAEGFPMLSHTVEVKRKQIEEEYEDESLAYNRANYVKSKLWHFVPGEQKTKVNAIYQKSFRNIAKLTAAMNHCLVKPDQSCVDYDVGLEDYDDVDLEVKISDEVDPHSTYGILLKATVENNQAQAFQCIRTGGNGLLKQCDPKGQSPFHHAVSRGHRDLVNLFLTNDPHPGAPQSLVHDATDDHRKYTPLCLAAEGGQLNHCRVIDFLLEKNTKVDDKTSLGLTPLQVACIHGKVETARKLISKGANRSVRDQESRSLMHLAAESGSVDLVDELSRQGLSVNATDEQLMTPLHYAAQNGHVEAVKILLRLGANPVAKDRGGRMPLRAGGHHLGVAEVLLPYLSTARWR